MVFAWYNGQHQENHLENEWNGLPMNPMQRRKHSLFIAALRPGLSILLAMLSLSFSPLVFAQSSCNRVLEGPKIVTTVNFSPHSRTHAEEEEEFSALLTELKHNKTFATLFAEFNEPEKGIRIETHVRDVFAQYLIELQQHPLNDKFSAILPITIALHDIGKPFAIAAGHRERQTDYTLPMLRDYLRQQQLTERDIELSLTLVGYTGFGDLLKGQRSVHQVANDLRKLAAKLQVNALDLFHAKRLFYISDAGSYSQLRPLLFTVTEGGHLEPRSPQLLQVERELTEDSAGKAASTVAH